MTLPKKIEYFSDLAGWEIWEILKFLFVIFLIFLNPKREKKKNVNSFFDLWDIFYFKKELKNAIFHNWKLARLILDPMHKGVRAWEYGLILSQLSNLKGKKILDIGTGSSTLPSYLEHKGGKISSLDLFLPEKKIPGVLYFKGSMEKLPFADNYCDMVFCISAIEHLDDDYKSLVKKTKKALMEMIRVLKPGGELYLTSDLYLDRRQELDRWSKLHNYHKIMGGYKADDFQKVFLDTILKSHCSLVGGSDFNFKKLIADKNRCNYRGRYFTTFAIFARKDI